MVDQAKRPTVGVTCGVRQGLVLQTHDPLDVQRVTLKHGLNPGIDKNFFDKWMAANSQSAVVLNGMLFAVEEGKERPDPWARGSK